jgi:hypothetical protein
MQQIFAHVCEKRKQLISEQFTQNSESIRSLSSCLPSTFINHARPENGEEFKPGRSLHARRVFCLTSKNFFDHFG